MAVAMRREAEFGTFETGRRADLLLVDANPLEGIANLAKIAGVVVRGQWLSAADLQDALRQVRGIYNPAHQPLALAPPSAEEIDALVRSMRELASGGFVFRDHDLEEIAELLSYAGRQQQSAALLDMRTSKVAPGDIASDSSTHR